MRSHLLSVFVLALLVKGCHSEPSKTCEFSKCIYLSWSKLSQFHLTDYIGELCERSQHYLSTYRKIDGAELISNNERNLVCTITFQTHSILQRFMLRFEVLKLDCNDHLYIFDGAHAASSHKADISCRNTKQSLGTLFTRTNYITLKYVTDGWGTDNSFKLVITAIKDGSNTCDESQ